MYINKKLSNQNQKTSTSYPQQSLRPSNIHLSGKSSVPEVLTKNNDDVMSAPSCDSSNSDPSTQSTHPASLLDTAASGSASVVDHIGVLLHVALYIINYLWFTDQQTQSPKQQRDAQGRFLMVENKKLKTAEQKINDSRSSAFCKLKKGILVKMKKMQELE